ncbi:MAG: plasmid pRiA4b ORF-3 family protein [Caldilineales bacterium]
MANKTVSTADAIYQLKITLRGSRPPIWRRVLVPGSFSLYKLHQVIQLAMGWTDSHLHQFIIDGQYYGIPSPDDWEPVIDERRHTLNKIAPGPKYKFIYEYDFGDSWEHEILVESIAEAEAGVQYPVCINGKRACPPEDVGGVWGYADFLEALSDPNHSEHEMYNEWIGGEFDPEEFDLDEINAELRRLK